MSPWTFPEKRPVTVTENEWITLGDGTRLGARLWIPEGSNRSPVPVVFEYIPYRKRDWTRLLDNAWGQEFSQYGFAYARVDIRGSGDSDGVLLDEYLAQEQSDAVEIIAWLARQRWSNGSVGMRGISWGGFSALQAAAMGPPQLRAIIALCCSDNRFTDDAHYIGGALTLPNFSWGATFQTVLMGPPDPEIVGDRWKEMWLKRLEAVPPILAKWLSHQRYDAFWQHGSIATDYGRIKCPVYCVGGLIDTYNNAIPRLLTNLTVPRKALIGPWGHTYPQLGTPGPGLDWVFEEVRWWEQWLRGIDTGIMREPMLRVYIADHTASQVYPKDTPGRWIAEETWPSQRLQPTVLFLNSRKLSTERAQQERLRYEGGKIVGLAKPEWLPFFMETELPREQTSDDRHSMTFDSLPLDADMEILGNPVARIRVSSSAPVAKLAVRLTEVTPQGKSWLVTYGLINLTHRSGHEHPAALTPGRFYDVEVPLFFVAHRLKNGHLIRIAISDNLWPLAWPSPHPSALTIATGVSSLTLPVRPPEETAASFPILIRRDTHFPSRTGGLTVEVSGPDEDGRLVIRKKSEERPRPLKDTGTALGGRSDWHLEITEGDPNSGVWKAETTRSYKRGSWDVTVVGAFELTSTPDAFHVTESIRAMEGGTLVFKRAWDNIIRRDLM